MSWHTMRKCRICGQKKGAGRDHTGCAPQARKLPNHKKQQVKRIRDVEAYMDSMNYYINREGL